MWNALSSAVNALYIDPSATSILLASITSIAVAAASVFIILWRKFKRGAKKVLKIDENAGKEVEEDLVILDDSAAEPAEEKEETKEAEATEPTEPAEEAKKAEKTEAAELTEAAESAAKPEE